MRDFEPVLTGILSAAASALTAAGTPAALVHLAPGVQPAWDNCCEGGGQLYLRIVEVYPTAGKDSPFPSKDTSQAGAGCSINLLGFRLALGVIRCAHVVDSNGVPPSAAQMTEDAVSGIDDMSIILDVIACTVPGLPGIMRMNLDRWVPQGVQGGCSGGEWTFTVAVDPCLCQTPPEPVPEV